MQSSSIPRRVIEEVVSEGRCVRVLLLGDSDCVCVSVGLGERDFACVLYCVVLYCVEGKGIERREEEMGGRITVRKGNRGNK